MIKYEISIVSLLHKNEVSIPCTQEISRDLRDFNCMPCTLTTLRWRRTTPATRWTSVRRQWRLPRQVPFYNFKTDSWALFLENEYSRFQKTPKSVKNHFWLSYNIQIRAQKGEDEVAELDAKAKQLETELDLTAEKLGYVSLQVKTLNQGLVRLVRFPTPLTFGRASGLGNLTRIRLPPGMTKPLKGALTQRKLQIKLCLSLWVTLIPITMDRSLVEHQPLELFSILANSILHNL